MYYWIFYCTRRKIFWISYIYTDFWYFATVVEKEFENYFHSEAVRYNENVNLTLVGSVSWNFKKH